MVGLLAKKLQSQDDVIKQFQRFFLHLFLVLQNDVPLQKGHEK
jgi:hypothetical protein